MAAGKFVCAALPSVHTQMINTLKELEAECPETAKQWLSHESLDSFLSANMNKFLTSIGVVMSRGSGISLKMINKYIKVLKKFNESEYLQNCELIVDSAGFQIQQNYLNRAEISEFIDLYHQEFLAKQFELFDWAFTLDIAPGAVKSQFRSFKDMEDLCDKSYKQAAELPEEIRNKMMYVHHFRTPKIHEIYKKMLAKYGDKFNHFATGGLVSFARTGDVPPYIMYAIPLIEVLDHVLQRGLKSFRFHVLGGADWKEILGHKFFERHIKEVFDIDVEITYDSSTIFKTLCLGRYTFRPHMESQAIKKLSIREAILHMRIDDEPDFDSVQEYFYSLVNEAVQPHGMKGLTYGEDEIYVKGNKKSSKRSTLEREFGGFTDDPQNYDGRITRLAYSYGMLQILRLFNIVEGWCNQWVDELYPILTSGQTNDKTVKAELNEKVENIMIMLNGGKTISRNIDLKAITIQNTLDLLTEFKYDREGVLQKCDHLIDRYLVKDECKDLLSLADREYPIDKGE